MGLEINLTLSVELSVAYDRSNTTVASKVPEVVSLHVSKNAASSTASSSTILPARVFRKVVKRLWSAKQTTSRRYVGPLCRKLNPHPGSIRYQQVSELPGTVSPHRPACPGNFSSTEVAELSAGSPVATNLHIQNCGSYANVPVHARLDIIYEEEPHHLGIIDEEGPHLGIIDEEEPHLIDPNDEGDFYGLDSYGTKHSLRASREDLDVGFSPSHPPGISTQSALILTPIPGTELLPPESKPYEKATLPVFHGLDSDRNFHMQSSRTFSKIPLKHRCSVPGRTIDKAERFAPARSKSAELGTNLASRVRIGCSKLEGYENSFESSSPSNAVDRFYAATSIVNTISQFVVPRQPLNRTLSRVDAQRPSSQCSTWTSAHSSLNKSLSLKTIQALLDGLPFEGFLTTATLGDRTFYFSAKTYCKTRQKLVSQAEPRYRFINGKMAESDQARLMCRAYPEMCCNHCSRKFGGQDRKRELVCHRKELHGVRTGTFGSENGESSGAHWTQQPKEISLGLDMTHELLAQRTLFGEISELRRAFSFENNPVEKLSDAS